MEVVSGQGQEASRRPSSSCPLRPPSASASSPAWLPSRNTCLLWLSAERLARGSFRGGGAVPFLPGPTAESTSAAASAQSASALRYIIQTTRAELIAGRVYSCLVCLHSNPSIAPLAVLAGSTRRRSSSLRGSAQPSLGADSRIQQELRDSTRSWPVETTSSQLPGPACALSLPSPARFVRTRHAPSSLNRSCALTSLAPSLPLSLLRPNLLAPMSRHASPSKEA